MSVVFGKQFTRSFTVHDGDGNTVAIDSIVSARIYASSPTESQIEDSAEALSGWAVLMSSSTAGQTNETLITYPELTDSDEHASGNVTYYEVVSFKLDSGGSTKFVVRPFTVVRPGSMYSRISTSSDDIDDLNSKFSALKGTSWVADKIALAKKVILNTFEGRGILAHRVDQTDLDDAMVFLVGALSASELMSENGDVWSERYELYKQQYETILNKYSFGVDADGDGDITATEQVFGGPVFVER